MAAAEPLAGFDGGPRERWRLLADGIARHLVTVGGLGVIGAVVLIGFYLFYVVLPLLRPAELGPGVTYPAPGGPGETLALALDEQAELGLRVAADGRVVFFRTADGAVVQDWAPPVPQPVAGAAWADPAHGLLALGLADGRIQVVRLHFEAEFGGGGRRIVPRVDLPFGPEPLAAAEGGGPAGTLAVRAGEDGVTVAVADVPPTAPGLPARVRVTDYARGGLGLDEAPLEAGPTRTFALAAPARALALAGDGRWLYALDTDGRLWAFDLAGAPVDGHGSGAAYAPAVAAGVVAGSGRDAAVPRDAGTGVVLLAGGEGRPRVTALRLLLGGQSILAGDGAGGIAQWFPVRGADGAYRVERVRAFDPIPGAVADLAAEHRRRGFLAVGADGTLAVYHSTAARRVLAAPLGDGPLARVAVAPRGNAVLAEDAAGRLHVRALRNDHPEVSWSALWGRVWYEGHEAPQFKWQSSAATSDVEPKYSLVPLTFGTLKAAFYAMLLAVPLAIAGAVYTAYFMAPRLRGWVKPTVEVMEALPTVILGFLAGLWLAPFVEANLPGVVGAVLALPVGVLLFARAWHALPGGFRERVGPGWEAALLVPVVIACVWAGLALGRPLEGAWFGGDLRGFLTRDLGVDFDQRNAVVVGIAMGFAVIPNIFSIAEDAVFGVPRHLVHGSLALGATPWQTVARVVLPTASSGLFSAVMIGFGRAVGETMIVLMATGNTPVLDFSPFLGMRTLSANLAVEMPESEVGGTHYRILFLAALVLFLFTFALNTLAEVVRHRLRRRYSAL